MRSTMLRFLHINLLIVIAAVFFLTLLAQYTFKDDTEFSSFKLNNQSLTAKLAKKEIHSSKLEKIIDHKRFLNLVEINNIRLLMLKIRNNKVSITVPKINVDDAKNKTLYIQSYLERLINRGAKFKDVIFYIYAQDYTDAKLLKFLEENPDAPNVFAFATKKESSIRNRIILFPDSYVLANKKIGYFIGWKKLSKNILNANNDTKWQNKIDKAVWRGMPWKGNTARQNILSLTKNNSKIDAKATKHRDVFTSFAEIIQSFIYESLALKFSLGNFLSQEDQIKYKMLINIDGFSCTYPGYLWRLLSNSITLKQETEDIQWFYSLLEPWKHYIPVSKNLSDLPHKINWVLQNNKQSKRIADRSTKLVKDNLMMNGIDQYVFTLLNEYASKQRR